MTALNTDPTTASRTVRPESAIAVTGLVAALLAQVLTRSGSLWLLLDVVGGLLTIGAARVVLRRRLQARRPAAISLADGLLAVAIAGMGLMVAVRGPEPRIAAAPLFVVSVFGTLLSLVIIGNGVLGLIRGKVVDTEPVAPAERRLQVLVLGIALITALVVARDAVLR
jgi:hypothetical protein